MTLPNLPAGCEWPKRPIAIIGPKCGARHVPEDERRLRAYALALERLIPQVAEAARREEREACALLHENLDVDCGVEPMSVAIEYRDKIRARGEPC